MKYTFLIMAGIFTVFFSCQNHKPGCLTVQKKETAEVRFHTETSLSHVPLKKESYVFNATKGEQIRTAAGARIVIPPNAFVNKNGETVQGPVQIAFTALNRPEEIIASGIPMQAMNKGQTGQFISDGMFSISATSGGSEVQLAQNKKLSVFTKVRDEKSEFDYWFFNEKEGRWENIGKRDRIASEKTIESVALTNGLNPYKGITLNNLRWHIPVEHFAFAGENPVKVELNPSKIIPGKYNPKAMVLDLNFNKSTYPDLAMYNNIMWQYAGDSYEADPANNNWLFQLVWTDVKMEPSNSKNGCFDLTITAGTRKFTSVVRPVVTGKDYEKASAEMSRELAKMEAARKEILQQGASEGLIQQNMYNAFSVSRLGTYNCDRFYSDPSARDYSVTFNYNGKTIAEGKTVYAMINNKSGVLQFTSGRVMHINPADIDALFVVAANGVIAATSAAGISDLAKNNRSGIHLNLEGIKIKITDLRSLKEALLSI